MGQSSELTVSGAPSLDDAVRAFHDRHERRYGFAAREAQVEIVTARVVAHGLTGKPALRAAPLAPPGAPSPSAILERRRVFDGATWVQTPVYRRSGLCPGNAFDGPAVIEQYDATTYLAPGWRASVDGYANVVLERC